MNRDSNVSVSRRSFPNAGAGLVAPTTPLPAWPVQASSLRAYRIVAQRTRVRLVGGRYPETEVWPCNGQVPGPEIRARQIRRNSAARP